MSPDTTHDRLDRIEVKLDKLADAMVSLARAEEKIAAMQENQSNHFERLNRFSQKLDEIESKVADNNRTVQLIHKLFWVVVIAAAGAIATNMWM